jgi:hypothetical protein
MADQKVSDLPSLNGADVDAADLLYIVDSSAGTAGSKKITVGQYQQAAYSAGTANGVMYLNGSNVVTTSVGMTFNGTTLSLSSALPTGSGGTGLTSFTANGIVYASSTSALATSSAATFDGTNFATTGTASATKLIPTGGAATGNGMYLPAANTLAWSNNGAETMRLNSSGNLGIGTSSPGAKLDVFGGYVISGTSTSTNGSKILGGYYSSGNIATFGSEFSSGGPVIGYGVWPSTASAGAFVSSTTINAFRGAYTIAGDIHVWYNGAAQTVAIDSAVTTSERMRLDSSGNLGIGTSSPGARLDVQSGQAEIRTLSTTGTNTARNYQSNTGGQFYQGIDSSTGANFGTAYAAVLWHTGNYPMVFATNNTERARITSGGDLLVGTTTTPSSSNAGFAIPKDANGTYLRNACTITSSRTHFEFVNGNGTVGSISTNGSATAFNTSSDRRLKENIQPADDAASVIDAIEIVQHDWKAGGHTRFGVIAQDLQAIAPEAVTAGDDGDEIEKTWGVDYSKLVPMLIKEVQSLRARVAALEAQ